MFCWTQNVPHIFVICLFTLLLSWVCVIFSESSTYFTELKTFCTGTEHVEVWLMWDHKQQYRIQKNCNRKRKKKAVHHFWFVLYCFNLFQQVLFESLFFCWFFFFSAQKTQKLLFISLWLHMSYHHVNSVFGCGTFFDLRFSLCPCLHNDILH